MTTAQAIKELMTGYDALRAKWIKTFGNDCGFDKWFKSQLFKK
jgi:hypothetical protein